MRGTKLSLYEGGVRMPFIISWPGHIPPGTVDSSSAMSAVDLIPSLASLSNISLPGDYRSDGIDRSAVLLGKPATRNKEMFWEYGRNDIAFRYPPPRDKSPNLAIRSEDWKLLMNSDSTDIQLYNIKEDKYETNNIQESEPAIVEKLKDKLLRWWDSLPKLTQPGS
ncbi:sulfatase [Chitinophaga sp. XS-30]|uniref:sulfatase family protein n=1 Tax=Chitinophaga sp. XS-30 TaxID=2604421 RepID=UPI001AEF4356|nr:sulfatase/phosphatase domain-containing protein [Chitinophaga sp. XS-30]